jgi:nicotinamide riboside kinase
MSDGHYMAMKGLGNKKDERTLIVNIYGGPGSGKSIMCANVFSELKWKHITAEMALEYVKEEVWEENYSAIYNQLFILGNQHQRIHRLLDKVDVILIDSPLLLSIHYDRTKNENFKKYVLDIYNSYRNINIFIDRNDVEFETKGRYHDLEQSKEIDFELKKLLNENNFDFHGFKMDKDSIQKIVNLILDELDN